MRFYAYLTENKSGAVSGLVELTGFESSSDVVDALQHVVLMDDSHELCFIEDDGESIAEHYLTYADGGVYGDWRVSQRSEEECRAIIAGACAAPRETDEYVNATMAAKMLGVSPSRISQLMKAHMLDFDVIGGRRMIRKASVEERMADCPKPGRRWPSK